MNEICGVCGCPTAAKPDLPSYDTVLPTCACDKATDPATLYAMRRRASEDTNPRLPQLRAHKAHLKAVYAERDALLRGLGIEPGSEQHAQWRRGAGLVGA